MWKIISLFFLLTGLAGLLVSSCQSRPAGVSLENEMLKVVLSADLPLIQTYTYKRSGLVFAGDSGSTGWVVNGHLYTWSEWKISAGEGAGPSAGGNADPNASPEAGGRSKADSRVYHLALPALNIGFDYTLSLGREGLNIGLGHISDPGQQLRTISWGDRSLLNTFDTSLQWWARQAGIAKTWERKKSDNRGLWSYDENRGKAGDPVADLSTVDACIWKPHEVLAGLVSNTDLLPVKISGGPGKGFSLGLNTWRYRISGQIMPVLSASLVFLSDINGDGEISGTDYFRWENLHLADVPDTIRGAISYKVFMDAPGSAEPVTTMGQLDKIVTAIHHITDGIPQIAYLTGWQYRGHDTGYPSFDEWNERVGPHKGVYDRSVYYRDHLNTCLSYHINIDDAYRSNKGFDTAIMATDFDGGPMFWQMFHADTAFHISHYKDRQTGSIFKRLNALLQTIPVGEVIHIDAMRTINCNPEWERDSLGVAQELDLGLKPILQWLKDRGIVVTTEGQNGMPHELTGLVAGVYHLDEPSEANLLIRHRKLLGGGWQEGRGRLECGLGTSLHEDLAYRKVGTHFGFTKDWNILRERIYLGSLLYLYYEQRQLVDAHHDARGWVLKFDDSTMTNIDTKNDHLLVTRGDLVIARDDDRFVPIGEGIYVFSKPGGETEWTLPENFRGKLLEVCSLSENGRMPAPVWKISGNKILLSLKAGIPVKITLKNGE